MDDEFWVRQLHQMAGFDNRLQAAVEQLGLKGIVRVGFIAQATDVIRDMVRATEQGDNLVQGMDAQTLECAVLRQPGFPSIYRTIVVEMVFNLDDLAKLSAFNHLLRGQKAGVEATILVRRDRQSLAFRQGE